MSVMAIGKKREGERNEKKMESEKEWTTSYTFDCPRAIRSAVFCINGGRRSNRTRPPPPYSHLPPSSLPATSTHYTRYARPPLFSVQNRAPDPNPNLSYLGSDLVTSVCMYYAYRILCFGKKYRLFVHGYTHVLYWVCPWFRSASFYSQLSYFCRYTKQFMNISSQGIRSGGDYSVITLVLNFSMCKSGLMLGCDFVATVVVSQFCWYSV
jgi:hypothetical protein